MQREPGNLDQDFKRRMSAFIQAMSTTVRLSTGRSPAEL
jgi:hypothetical protein